ncbi:predicted protein [Plenodomus lingam JN3]|uniref:Predicted protein n=1 Tax=Leptosphaeria maculans (strain JN3 / isolate v23.1.3 / race Av1-4-5-6-7-8) TaxID=985895 RepID=E5A4W0_LEPMJ|nr:predicted protein [Plenodomus lingam JN3]CBX98658.1 predicted protein [Plenodomus lingam JN3]
MVTTRVPIATSPLWNLVDLPFPGIELGAFERSSEGCQSTDHQEDGNGLGGCCGG